MRKSIFDNTTLTFSVPGVGAIDPATGFWTEPTPTEVSVHGDLQPYVRTGREQIVAPEGFKLADAKMFISSVDLPTIEDSEISFAASTTISGRQYYIATKYDFSNGNLDTDRIFYILMMKKLTGG